MATHSYRFIKPPPRGGFFVLALVLLWSSATPLHAQPKLVLPDGDRFEFGPVIAGERPLHKLRVANAGSAALRINHVTVQCNCTTIRIPVREIPPGREGIIEVSLSSDFEGGRVEKSLSILSNDPDAGIRLVRFGADVRTYVEVSPRAVGFSRGEAAAKSPKQLLVTNRDTAAITLLSVVDSSFLVQSDGGKMRLEPGKSAVVSIVPRPVGESTRDGTIELRFDSPKQPRVLVRYIIEGGRKTGRK